MIKGFMNKKFIIQKSILLIIASLFFVNSLMFPAITSGSDFQKIPKSARAIALGESYTAAIDDIAAIDYNPAALNTMKNIGFSLMYQTWIDNSFGAYGAAGYRLGSFVFGSSFYYLNYGGFKEYDYFGNYVQSYNPCDMNLKLAVSADGGILAEFLKGLSIGMCVSGIYRSLLDDYQLGMTVDAGIHYKTTLSKLLQINDEYFNETVGFMPINAGFSIQNIGFSGEFMAPLRMNAGISIGLFRDFFLSFDISKDYNDTPLMFKCGAEYTLFDILSVRCGFNIGKDSGNFSAGFGIKYPLIFDNLRFDYAFSPLGVMGNNNSFSIYGEFLFGRNYDDYFSKGLYYYNKQDYLKARELWRNALNLSPKSEEVIRKLKKVNEMIDYNLLDPDRLKSTNTLYISQLDSVKSGVSVNNQFAAFLIITKRDNVTNVSLTGDFNNWNINNLQLKADNTTVLSNTIWSITLRLMKGVYMYKFVINGSKFEYDMNNPVFTPDGKGGTNSILLIETSDSNQTKTMETAE